jgi:predicted deacylase
MANIFVKEILEKCTHGIDIHSGSVHRTNFPQVRLELTDKEEIKLAKAFGAPVIIHSPLRPGTLRKTAQEKGLKMLLFEGGEALRFDDQSISVCIHGILNVMREIGMLPKDADGLPPRTTITAKSSHWIRAQNSGSLRTIKKLGDFVQADELLGTISDPLGQRKTEVRSLKPGVVIGVVTMPLVNRGNALFHIATLDDMKIADTKDTANVVLDQEIDIENEDWFIRK